MDAGPPICESRLKPLLQALSEIASHPYTVDLAIGRKRAILEKISDAAKRGCCVEEPTIGHGYRLERLAARSFGVLPGEDYPAVRLSSKVDSLGHEAGDSVLRKVGDILRTRLRRLDRVFRLGGEEFLALLEDTDGDDATTIADDLRQTISVTELLPEQNITISIGAATYRSGEPILEWMKRADENLYEAKARGRDKVVA